MALATVTVTTGGSTLNKVWRKVQGALQSGIKTKFEEGALVKSLKTFDVDLSAREITTPVDLNRAYGTAVIPEGGYEANPVTPNVEEITLTWSNFNQRWTTTLTSKYLDQKGGLAAQIIRQFKYQALKAVEAMSHYMSQSFYGYSSGVRALNTTVATQSSGAYTLGSAYGDSTLTNAAFIASFFQIGDRVALVRSAALVTNGIGVITAVSRTTPSITVTWIGSVTSANADAVVLANNIENATLAAGTHYNQDLVGLSDASLTASIHGLSSSSVATWAAGYSDTAGGRFSAVKFRKARQGISANGGGKADMIIMAQGVKNDVFANLDSARRFTDNTMELDGEPVASGFKWFDSPQVPNGYTWVLDSTNSVKKFELLPAPTDGSMPWEDGDKIQDRNAYAFSIDYPMALVWVNRGNLAYFNGLTEQ